MKEKFSVKESRLKGVFQIDIRSYADERGYFLESYNKEYFERIGIPSQFVQDDESVSHKNVIRGLHFQKPPYAQGKLVRVIQGSIKDVVVDIRKSSPTYGQWDAFLLGSNKKIVWMPEGFAHGFLSLEDDTLVQYKLTAPYKPECEGGLRFNDPSLGIQWGNEPFIVSEKDTHQPLLSEITPFE
ncbi:MAG: dTDP-4-dehydrorhamnose 3,5-epimerase [Parcubacteria group bacterium Gr01-1014_38]|nr:MAG: dTDP-4-dehydrorhamnose 3,5-epimerase [Parcubacteria group bacterium Gr01-1014_38]